MHRSKMHRIRYHLVGRLRGNARRSRNKDQRGRTSGGPPIRNGPERYRFLRGQLLGGASTINARHFFQFASNLASSASASDSDPKCSAGSWSIVLSFCKLVKIVAHLWGGASPLVAKNQR